MRLVGIGILLGPYAELQLFGEEKNVNPQSLNSNHPHFLAPCGSLSPVCGRLPIRDAGNCISNSRMLQTTSPIPDQLRSLSPSDHTETLGNARLRGIIGNFPAHMGTSDFPDNQKDFRFRFHSNPIHCWKVRHVNVGKINR